MFLTIFLQDEKAMPFSSDFLEKSKADRLYEHIFTSLTTSRSSLKHHDIQTLPDTCIFSYFIFIHNVVGVVEIAVHTIVKIIVETSGNKDKN
jgi:hypothetical protein